MNDVARLAEQQPDPSREVRAPDEPQSLTLMLPVHRFLRRTACYILIALTCLALLLLELRMYLVHAPEYHWMRWNLFLAWVPYAASLWIAALSRDRAGAWWRVWLPALLWLLFFPNAPYLVTDLRHLQEIPSPLPGFDLGMLSVFAITGWLLGVDSLQIVHGLVREHAGARLSWAIVLAVSALSMLGVYLGWEVRLNSWDMLLHPASVLHAAAAALVQLPLLAGWTGAWLVSYLLWHTLRPLGTTKSAAQGR